MKQGTLGTSVLSSHGVGMPHFAASMLDQWALCEQDAFSPVGTRCEKAGRDLPEIWGHQIWGKEWQENEQPRRHPN